MTAPNIARPAVEYEPEAIQGEQPGNPNEAALTDLDLGQFSAELLDPAAWGEVLSRFGRTTNLAVALVGVNGNLLGPCHNPQPVWTLSRAGLALEPASCPFCLIRHPSCSAVTDALNTGEIFYVHEPSGMAHVAIPLTLGNRRLGVLLAGQTFDQYPQPLALRRAAKTLGVSPQDLWNAAVHQIPVSRATLRHYSDLLASLGQAFLRQRYAAILDRKLHQTNERYRLIMEGSKGHALITVDAAGRVTSWNPGAEHLFGYTESEILGADYSRFFTPEDIRHGLPGREIRAVGQSGRMEYEGWRVRKDGTRFLTETVTARLGEGDAVEYGKLLHDVTEERRSAESVLEAQKLESIGVLAGGIAHDFNNLLTTILGNVSLAMLGLAEDDPARPLLDVAQRTGHKAATLIAQLLAYAGKGNSIATRFDLSALIAEILPLIETSIPKTVRLELSLPAGLPWMQADISEIEQIVMNLVINGAEAVGPEGGSLWVSTAVSASGGVCLEVRDSGCGMDEATQRRIFEPFFTTKFTGRGLGLAAVSGILQRLKGRLELTSAPGEGSTFRVVFPGGAAQVPEPKAIAKIDLHGIDLHGKGLILVVDDEPMIRDIARAVLERFGYSVLTAENGQTAVEVFRLHADSIAAVLLDLTMPVMGGGEAFNLINQIRPGVPVLISSGYGDNSVREQFNGSLAGVIRKPYTVLELREKIAAVIMLKKANHA